MPAAMSWRRVHMCVFVKQTQNKNKNRFHCTFTLFVSKIILLAPGTIDSNNRAIDFLIDVSANCYEIKCSI